MEIKDRIVVHSKHMTNLVYIHVITYILITCTNFCYQDECPESFSNSQSNGYGCPEPVPDGKTYSVIVDLFKLMISRLSANTIKNIFRSPPTRSFLQCMI